ncbi:MAG: prokaryotic E2 ligase family D protein [Tannerellaceae bacterium]|nr:prokaryotic E2 ligase family D protein [Tannerellaceae bacterium]
MRKRIDDKFEKELKPYVALVGYQNSDDNYFEIHPIEKTEEGYTLGVGSPLTYECISEIASNFSAEFNITPHGAIPSTLLYFDNRIGLEKYVWYNPPCKRRMFFSKSLNIEDGEYCVPGIVYMVNGENLDVYAFKGKKPSNKLFNAPFFNVTNGSVCLGNAKVKYPENPSFADYIKYWEDKFWLTEFSHLGSNPVKGNLVLVTKESKERFNERVLESANKTLKELIEDETAHCTQLYD